jgi:hypothetical protein
MKLSKACCNYIITNVILLIFKEQAKFYYL